MITGGIKMIACPATTLPERSGPVLWRARYCIKNHVDVRMRAKHSVAWPPVGVGSRSRTDVPEPRRQAELLGLAEQDILALKLVDGPPQRHRRVDQGRHEHRQEKPPGATS